MKKRIIEVDFGVGLNYVYEIGMNDGKIYRNKTFNFEAKKKGDLINDKKELKRVRTEKKNTTINYC